MSILCTAVTVDITRIATVAGELAAVIAFVGILVRYAKKGLKKYAEKSEALLAQHSHDIDAVKAELAPLRQSQQVVLWYRLEKECKRVLARGYLIEGEPEMLTVLYEAYHQLGGNGRGTTLYQRAANLSYKDE